MAHTIRRSRTEVRGAIAKNCFDALQEALQTVETLHIVQVDGRCICFIT